ncbi:hypothetical protein AB0C52_16645 [Streptomyces sp. NPDC048717]|uniref:hypothetical protein n=1 Tax=Streptomyces sp. NPDC048717 TaxID=3154928 RepID=UPI00344AC9C2
MNCYALVVRRWWTVPAALVLLVLTSGTVGAGEVPVPSLNGGMAGARVTYFTPVIVVIAVMYCLDRRFLAAETTAVVPVHRLDQGAVALTALLAHGAGLVVGMDVARNVTLLLALALLVRRLSNEAAATVAGLALLILNVMLGRAHDAGGHATHTWWALALYPARSAGAWLVPAGLFLLALGLSASRRPSLTAA